MADPSSPISRFTRPQPVGQHRPAQPQSSTTRPALPRHVGKLGKFAWVLLQCGWMLAWTPNLIGQTPDSQNLSSVKAVGKSSQPPVLVHWLESSFWGQRSEACRRGTLPTLGKWMLGDDKSQFVHNFRIAAGQATGRHRGPKWNDGDTYKWLEALSLMYHQTRDHDLLELIDTVIELISLAQRGDGYLHTPVLIAERNGQPGNGAFADPVNFEMYNMGHLMTAACVHFEVTGDQRLLAVACRAADFLDRHFENPSAEMARHAVCPSHYMGIIDLYRVTGQTRYLKLAQRWLAMRDSAQGGDDNQDRIPFFDQREAVGHAVRANYLYAGAADLFLETGDPRLWKSLDACWQSVQTKKLYVTGGCGALYDGASPDGSEQQSSITRVHQAYGRNYQLPNATAHNETCAAIGNVLWNHRMWKASGQAKYIDALEHSLFNAVLSGISLDGTRFFYTNTLRQLEEMPAPLRWPKQRQEWISCYCCPPNVARLVAGAGRLACEVDQRQLSLLIYGSSKLDTVVPEAGRLVIDQISDYPFDGRILLTIQTAPKESCTISCRIPGWCPRATLSINGRSLEVDCHPQSFVELSRVWQVGDQVELNLEMPIELLAAHRLVEECLDQVAVRRGPLIYCLESTDLPQGVGVMQAMIPTDNIDQWSVEEGAAELKGISVLRGKLWIEANPEVPSKQAGADSSSPSQALYGVYRPASMQLTEAVLVPYFAWGNRQAAEMTVWLRKR